MKDRVTSGFIAGIIAGVAMNIVDWTGYSSGLYAERLLDWAAVAIYGRLPDNVVEVIWAQIGQIFFAGFLGILFASMLLKLTSGNYLIKGWIFGVILWFGIYATSIAIRLPNLEMHSFWATFSHFLSASVYGLVVSFVLNYLEKTLRL